MYHPPLLSTSRFFGATPMWMSILLLDLLVGGLFFGLGFSTVQVRLNGVQTTAIAHADGVCASDDSSSGDSYSFSYAFTGTNDQPYRIAQHAFCTNVYQDGDHVTIWYLPDHPSQITTDLDVHMLSFFSAMGVLVIVSLVAVSLRIQRARRKAAHANIYTNDPYNQVGFR